MPISKDIQQPPQKDHSTGCAIAALIFSILAALGLDNLMHYGFSPEDLSDVQPQVIHDDFEKDPILSSLNNQ